MVELKEFLQAIQAGDVDDVERLLTADPELLEARTETGVSPVLMAVYSGTDAVLARLLERDPRLDLHEAAALGRVDLIGERARDNAEAISATGADGWTPVHLAAFFGHPEATRLLLELGADLRAVSANAIANTPLHAAIAGRRNRQVIDMLLEAGAPVDAVGGGGFTPLHVAASRGDRELVDRLVALGASPDAATAEGKSPADIAEEYGHPATAAQLRESAG